MTLYPNEVQEFTTAFAETVDAIGGEMRGKQHVVRLVLAALIAKGHVLLEDKPGVGKTLLAKSLSATFGGETSRIQFTPDLLPSDILGVSIWNQGTREFELKRGPIFANIVLADEINRASPKTQSALLQVMEEHSVTVDVTTHKFNPFMVIATQNPIEQAGTYPLPEAQLDRFLIKSSIGYPERGVELGLMREAVAGDEKEPVRQTLTAEGLATLQEIAAGVTIEDAVLDYAWRLVDATRDHPRIAVGVSVRGAIQFVRLAKVWAIAGGSQYVHPQDIQDLAVAVLAHRLVLELDEEYEAGDAEAIVAGIRDRVAVPEYRRRDEAE